MAVNRFFNPSRGQYIQQFVPEELPTDLMIGALGQKQKAYDTQQAMNIQLGEWNERALPGYDTKYVADWKNKVQSFVDESQGQDLSSPEYQRKYQDFIRKFKNDQGLSSVRAAVSKDDAFWKRVNELKQDKDTAAYAESLANEYLTRRGKYTSETGLGFTGDILLGDENVLTGTDPIKDAKNLFDDIKASGSENVREFAQGIHYKNGWEGVSGKTVNNRVSEMLEAYTNSRAGEQLTQEYNMKVFGQEVPSIEISKLNNQQRQEYERGKRQYIADFLNKAGGEFIYNKTETNLDTAKNKLTDWGREDLKEYPQQPNISFKGDVTGYEMPTFEQTFGDGTSPGMLAKNNEAINNYQNNIATYKKLLNFAKTGQGLAKDKYGKPILTQQEKALIQGIPGAIELVNGQSVPQRIKETFTKTLEDSVDDLGIRLYESQKINKEITEKTRNAAMTIPEIANQKFQGMNFKEALERYESLNDDPIAKPYKDTYDKLQGANKVSFIDQNVKRLREEADKEKDPSKKLQLLRTAEKVRDLKGHFEAHNALNKVFEEDALKGSTKKMEDYKLAFNSINEFVPTATAKPLNKTYNAYRLDETTGKPVKVGPTINADYIMEDMMNKSPSSFIVYDLDTGERISPTTTDAEGNVIPNPEYPVQGHLKLVSSDKELIRDQTAGEKFGTKAQFNVTGRVPIWIEDPNDPDKKKASTKDKRYKFVAAGTAVDTYTKAKAQEAYSNYILDPNSTAGQQSYKDWNMYSRPDHYRELAKVSSLAKEGENAYLTKSFYNTKTHKPELHEVKVTKSKSGDNNFLMKVYDSTGKEVVKELRFKNIVDLGETLDQIEKGSKAIVDQQQAAGIQPDFEEVKNKFHYNPSLQPTYTPQIFTTGTR